MGTSLAIVTGTSSGIVAATTRLLAPQSALAGRIVAFLESDSQPRLTERRLGGS